LVRDPTLNSVLPAGDWLELVAIGVTIAFSPVHLGLLFWLMSGPQPRLRSSLLVLSWMTISGLMIGLCAVAILEPARTGLSLPWAVSAISTPLFDALAAMSLVAVGIAAMLGRGLPSSDSSLEDHSEPVGQLDRLLELPYPLLLALSWGWQLLSPEDGLLDIRIINRLRASGIPTNELIPPLTVLWLISGCLMILPLVFLLALGPAQIGDSIAPFKLWLSNHARIATAIISLGMALYLGWQGWTSWSGLG
jgi:hypothetical protein